MPELVKQVADMDVSIRGLDARIAQLERSLEARLIQMEQKIEARFGQLLNAINQLHERVVRVEATVEAYTQITRHQLGGSQDLIERLVRLEMSQSGKRRRAG
jgi:hypothetical protein